MGWIKLSIPRIRFDRIGNDETRDWSNVRAVKFVYNAIPTAVGAMQFDDLFITAGADGRALTGSFRVRYKFVFEDEKFTDESLPSPVSDKIGLTAEGLQVVIPKGSAMKMDPQTTGVWIYIWSASMGAYYRAIDPISLNRSNMSLNEWGTTPPDGIISAIDRLRILTLGMAYGRRYIPGTDPTFPISVPSSPSGVAVTDDSAPLSVAYTAGPGPNPAGDFPIFTWEDETGDPYIGFAMALLNASAATITSITVSVAFSTDDLGVSYSTTISYAIISVINGVVYEGTLQTGNVATNLVGTETLTVNPATGFAWTVAERNNASFGIHFYRAAGYSTVTLQNYGIKLTNVYTTAGGAGSTVTSGNVLTFNIQTSEAELLLRNEKLKVGRSSVPDNIIGIVGSHFERTLCLAIDFLYFSDPGHPSVYPTLQAIKVSDGVNEKNLWIHKASGSVYIGTTKDIYRLEGDLTEFPNGTLNANLHALNLGSPPVDSSLAFEGNALVYRASDGPRMLVGETSTPLQGDLQLLIRGIERYGVAPIPGGDRHRLAMADGYLYWAIPPTSAANRRVSVSEWLPPPDGEVSASDRRRILTLGLGITFTSALLRYDFSLEKWSRRPYSRVIRSITRSLEGDVLAGTNSGELLQIDTGTDDTGQKISATAWTTQQDGGKPLSRKIPFDLSIRIDTGGEVADIGIYLDGASSPDSTFQASTDGQQVFLKTISDLPAFRRIQLRFEGSFNTFKLYDWNVSYRDMPQHHYHLDTGNVETGSEYYHWFREIRILVRTDFDLNVDVYFDDTLSTTELVTIVTPGKAQVYTIPLGRTIRGQQPRVVVRTTADAAAGEDGFELYWVEWRVRPSGNVTQKPVIRWNAVGK